MKFVEIIKKLVDFKTPLVLATVSQAATVGIYMYHSSQTNVDWFNLLVAIIAAFALDLMITATSLIPKPDYKAWIAAVLTSITALVFSSGIAFALYDGEIWHIAFPVMVFFYSWSLAFSKEKKLPEISSNSVAIEDYRIEVIKKLLATGSNNTEIAKIVGGNTKQTMELVKSIRNELEKENTDE